MKIVWVSRDAVALALGADEVAAALAPHATVLRNGSLGMHWAEPLVEVVVDRTSIAYGPVLPDDVPGLLEAGFLEGAEHPLRLGPTLTLPWLQAQQRLTFARVGIIEPLALDDYSAYEGYVGLERAVKLSPEAIVAEITASGLRGRGGAAFPAGVKWKTVLDTPADQKYVVCNADEGDAGTFSDRMLMEGDPFCLIEGATIAGLATGADRGFVYVRSEYPHAFDTLRQAVAIAEEANLLGDRILGTGRSFHLEIRKGAGSYVCGEETALLESLEGKRGEVRAKPPFPAVVGLFGKPTVVNNVITLASVPVILARGADAYRALGSGRSRGTLPVQLAGNVKRGGLVEVPFGTPLRTLVYDFGGGTASGRPVRAVQVGGPLGTYLSDAQLDTPLDYEALAGIGGILGHGGLVVFDDTVDMAQMARFAMQFCALESCGKCTPCRIGSKRGVELLDHIIARRDLERDVALLHDLCATMEGASLCAMGGLTPHPVRSALREFPEDFGLGGGACSRATS